ncbi:MAG: hypothetical protein AAFN77_11555 [Planctomycetota bacterium]
MDSKEILEREYLVVRAKILEIAAALDRIERAAGDVADSQKAQLISKGIEILASQDSAATRAENVQLLFSRQYDSKWLGEFNIESRV